MSTYYPNSDRKFRDLPPIQGVPVPGEDDNWDSVVVECWEGCHPGNYRSAATKLKGLNKNGAPLDIQNLPTTRVRLPVLDGPIDRADPPDGVKPTYELDTEFLDTDYALRVAPEYYEEDLGPVAIDVRIADKPIIDPVAHERVPLPTFDDESVLDWPLELSTQADVIQIRVFSRELRQGEQAERERTR